MILSDILQIFMQVYVLHQTISFLENETLTCQ